LEIRFFFWGRSAAFTGFSVLVITGFGALVTLLSVLCTGLFGFAFCRCLTGWPFSALIPELLFSFFCFSFPAAGGALYFCF